MAAEKELELLEKIDTKLEEIVFRFIENYNLKVSKEIQDAILEFIDTLDTDLAVKERLIRSKQINKFRTELEKVVLAGALADGYKQLIVDYKELVGMANEYFSLLSISYDKLLYKEIYKDSILFLKESLTGAGINQFVVNPIVDKLYELNLKGIKKKDLKAFLKEFFDKNNITNRYIEQITTDSLYQMTSNYQLKISEDLNIEYYYYAGTRMKTSRQFCISRYGKVYTKKEVQSWAELTWQGKVPGTDKSSIFYYRGGYNCRHTLRPISKTLYNKLK